VVLFAGLTAVSQWISPARGQSLLPSLPSLTIRSLPHGGSVETYFEPGGVGVNQFHVIFDGPAAAVASVAPVVTAGVVGDRPQMLRQLKLSPGHYTEFVVLTSGHWRFHVRTPFGSTAVSFTVNQSVP
jgi:hypothetical protein